MSIKMHKKDGKYYYQYGTTGIKCVHAKLKCNINLILGCTKCYYIFSFFLYFILFLKK